jgi:hypothetical protein
MRAFANGPKRNACSDYRNRGDGPIYAICIARIELLTKDLRPPGGMTLLASNNFRST